MYTYDTIMRYITVRYVAILTRRGLILLLQRRNRDCRRRCAVAILTRLLCVDPCTVYMLTIHGYSNCKRFAPPANPTENFGFLGLGYQTP